MPRDQWRFEKAVGNVAEVGNEKQVVNESRAVGARPAGKDGFGASEIGLGAVRDGAYPRETEMVIQEAPSMGNRPKG